MLEKNDKGGGVWIFSCGGDAELPGSWDAHAQEEGLGRSPVCRLRPPRYEKQNSRPAGPSYWAFLDEIWTRVTCGGMRCRGALGPWDPGTWVQGLDASLTTVAGGTWADSPLGALTFLSVKCGWRRCLQVPSTGPGTQQALHKCLAVRVASPSYLAISQSTN